MLVQYKAAWEPEAQARDTACPRLRFGLVVARSPDLPVVARSPVRATCARPAIGGTVRRPCHNGVRGHAGFTLLELVLAVAISVVLMGALYLALATQFQHARAGRE